MHALYSKGFFFLFYFERFRDRVPQNTHYVCTRATVSSGPNVPLLDTDSSCLAIPRRTCASGRTLIKYCVWKPILRESLLLLNHHRTIREKGEDTRMIAVTVKFTLKTCTRFHGCGTFTINITYEIRVQILYLFRAQFRNIAPLNGTPVCWINKIDRVQNEILARVFIRKYLITT